MSEYRSGRLSIIPTAAVFDEQLSNAELRVLNALGAYADSEGRCWPAVTTLAKRLGKSDRWIRACIRKLQDRGYIEIGRRLGRSNQYKIVNRIPGHENIELKECGTSRSGVARNAGTPASGGAERGLQGTPEHELPPNDTKNEKENDYVFDGVVIHMAQADFKKWQTAYHAIPDLRAALQQRDDYLVSLPSDDRRRKDWFIPTSNWLAKKHQEYMSSPLPARTNGAYDPSVIH